MYFGKGLSGWEVGIQRAGSCYAGTPSTKQLTNPPIPSPKPTNHIWPPPKLLGQFVTKSPQHSTLDKSIFFTTFGRRQIPVLTRIVPSSCFGGTKTFDWQHNVPTGHL